MSEKRGRGQPKFEPTQDQRSQVKQMKALGIPEDRICKTITNPRTGKPVSPMTLARAFAREFASGATEFHTLVGNFILCAILGKKPALGAEEIALNRSRSLAGRSGRPRRQSSQVTGDRWFESISLQRGVCEPSVPVETETSSGPERQDQRSELIR